MKQVEEKKQHAQAQLKEMKQEVAEMVHEESDRNQRQIAELRREMEKVKASESQMKEREQSRQMEQARSREVLLQVDKHLKTLVKHLRTVVESTQDPVIIEHQQRQINNIEKVHAEIQALNVYGNLEHSFGSSLKFHLDEQHTVTLPNRASQGIKLRKRSKGPHQNSGSKRRADDSLFTEADTIHDQPGSALHNHSRTSVSRMSGLQ